MNYAMSPHLLKPQVAVRRLLHPPPSKGLPHQVSPWVRIAQAAPVHLALVGRSCGHQRLHKRQVVAGLASLAIVAAGGIFPLLPPFPSLGLRFGSYRRTYRPYDLTLKREVQRWLHGLPYVSVVCVFVELSVLLPSFTYGVG